MTKTTSRKKTKSTCDFKRIKAKVGKRAVKPANVTDTSFRSTSIAVSHQELGNNDQRQTTKTRNDDPTTIAKTLNNNHEAASNHDTAAAAAEVMTADGGLLYSSKGKSLQDLISQLSHPAPNVRISALKGMQAIVADCPQRFIISQYYYLLVPAMAKCLVDVDMNVRLQSRTQLGHTVVLTSMSSSSSSNHDDDIHFNSLKPYIPLLSAYIVSALNSLDYTTRIDGAKTLLFLFHSNHTGKSDIPIIRNAQVSSSSSLSLWNDTTTSYNQNRNSLFTDEEIIIGRLVPALVGLMMTEHPQLIRRSSDQSQQLYSLSRVKNNKKNCKKTPPQPRITTALESDKCIILQCLVAILKSLVVSSSSRTTSGHFFSNWQCRHDTLVGNNNTSSHIVVRPECYSVVLLQPNHRNNNQSRATKALTKIHDIPPFRDGEYDNKCPQLQQQQLYQQHQQLMPLLGNKKYMTTIMEIPTNIMTDVTSKLCDHLVEALQSSSDGDDLFRSDSAISRRRVQPIVGTNVAMEELDLIVTAIHMVWMTLGYTHIFCLNTTRLNNKVIPNNVAISGGLQPIIQQWRHLISILLDAFPIVANDNQQQQQQQQQQQRHGINDYELSLCDRLNLTICSAIIDISSSLMIMLQLDDTEHDMGSWVDPILQYLLSLMEHDNEKAIGRTGLVVNVLAQLLLLRQGHSNSPLLLPTKQCHSILQILFSFIFLNNKSHDFDDENRMRSPAGRRVAKLVQQLVADMYHLDPFQEQPDAELSKLLVSMLSQSLLFLKAWRGDFTDDSCSILSLLIDVVRRISPETPDTYKQQFLQQLRQDLSFLFASAKPMDRSIFELAQASTQRHILALLCFLEAPTAETISNLGLICARGGNNQADAVGISAEIEDSTVLFLHRIRRSAPMQSYLGFLIQSTGILNFQGECFNRQQNSVEESDKGNTLASPGTNMSSPNDTLLTILLSYDRKIRRACLYLTDCANTSKLAPMLHPLLMSWLDASITEKRPLLFALRARAAVAILAWLSRDFQTYGDGNSITELIPGFERVLVVALTKLLNYLPIATGDGDDVGSISLANSILSPIISLLQSEPFLLKQIILELVAQMKNDSTRLLQASPALDHVLLIIRSTQIAEAFGRQKCEGLAEIVHTLDISCVGNARESVVRKIRLEVEKFVPES